MSRPAGYLERSELLDARGLLLALQRLSAEIRAAHGSLSEAVLVGIQTRGVPLARRLAELVERDGGGRVPVGTLDITLYRDDLTQVASQPLIKGTHVPVSIDGKSVILVDDVLFTGRTARAALDELIDFGRPARIQLCALIDRGHRELPIHGDFVGKRVATARDEIVQVRLAEEDGEDRVVLLGPAAAHPRPAAGRPRRGRR
jgi:pyrimidine operon attenuation protein/uracil phosphoribosyltransferase